MLVDIGDRSVWCERRGAGEPLLLIQGMSGHHGMWGEPFLRELERDFEVLAYDHRGIGKSDRADEPFSVANLADDAAKLLAAVGWPAAHVLGISLGGMAAQELALRHRDSLRTLTLGCTFASPAGNAAATGVNRMLQAMSTRDRDTVPRTAFEVNLSAEFRARPGAYELFRRTALSVKVPTPVVVMQAQAGAAHDTMSRLPSLAVPTLVVHGTEDELIAWSNAVLIADLVPGAKLELLDGVGHLFWWERPERSAELIRRHALGR